MKKMREIKFRAWNKLTNQMIYDIQEDKEHNQKIITSFGFMLKKNNYEIMQFTGLYDKKNVPIYEGDILENTAVNFKFIVKFIKTKWALQKLEFPEDSLDMYDFFHRIPTMFEVIGNIYDIEVENEED